MIILWLIAVELIGLAALPLAAAFLPGLRDRGYGVAKTLGLLSLTWLNWVLGTAAGLGNIVPLLWLLAVGLFAAGWWALRRRGEDPRALLRGLTRTILVEEGLFVLAFLAWAMVRAYHPDIFGTEKPMDMMYLTTSMEHHRFAPPDLWLSGATVNYYYLGYMAMATLANMAATTAPVAFNLALATVFGLTLSGAYSLGLTLTRSLGWALLAPAFVGLSGNLTGWMQVWGNLTSGVSNWAQVNAWCASRVIGGCANYSTINEFPFFSFVWGDLHPHVIALPFALLCLAIGLNVILAAQAGVAAFGPAPLSWPFLGLAALVLGSLYAINSWDLPTYLLLAILALVAVPFLRGATLAGAVREAVLPAAALAVLSVALWSPFWLGYHSSARGLGFEIASTNVGEYLTVNGAFLVPVLLLLLICTGPRLWAWAAGSGREEASDTETVAVASAGDVADQEISVPTNWRPVLVGAGVVAVLLIVHGSLTLLALLALALVAHRLLGPGRESDPAAAFAWLAVAIALGLTIMCEFVYLRDIFDGGSNYRMNTIFKFYYEIWILLGVAAAWAFATAWRWASSRVVAAGRGRRFGGWHWAWGGLLAVVLLTTGTFTVLAVPSAGGSQGAVPTLNGMAYLQTVSPGDYAAITWLGSHAPLDAVVAEAEIPNQGDYWGNEPAPQPSRPGQVSVFSGLPTLIEAAPSHEGLWHPNDPAINLHQDAVAAIYGPDAAAAEQAIATYHVQYIYVGPQEVQFYAHGDAQAPNLTKFSRVMHLGVVYQSGGVTIYGA